MKFNCCSKLLKLHQRAFKTLQIHDSIIERLKLKGITKPSNSQRAMLPVLYSNTDLILKDATGSGKTLGLCLGVLSKKVQELAPQMRFDSEPLSQQQLDFNKRRLGKTYLAILFIVPTRELALQIYHWIIDLHGSTDPNVVQCVFAGTPKRLLELQKKKYLDTSRLQLIVIDEVDRIVQPLSRYATKTDRAVKHIHIPDGEVLIDTIINERREDVKTRHGIGHRVDTAKTTPLQVVVSSATINNPLRRFMTKKKWLVDPALLNLNVKSPDGVEHVGYLLDSFGRYTKIGEMTLLEETEDLGNVAESLEYTAECIVSLCHTLKIKKALVFAPSTTSITNYTELLKSMGLKAETISKVHDYNKIGSKPFERMINGDVDIVVATEFEARGIDLPGIEHVFMLGETTPQSYLHVSGRTARFGGKGTCISILTNPVAASRYLKTIKRMQE